MTQSTLKYACMTVLILLAGIALNPTWAGGDHHEAKIKIIGEDFELNETDISDLAVGESMSFYTDSGREVLVVRENDGFDISVDGESLNLPSMVHGDHHGNGFHGVKVITRDIICDDDEGCDHEFINIHEGGDFEVLELLGEELALDIEVLQDFECSDEQECKHAVKIWHDSDGHDYEFNDESEFEFSDEDGKKVITIKKRIHATEGEEI